MAYSSNLSVILSTQQQYFKTSKIQFCLEILVLGEKPIFFNLVMNNAKKNNNKIKWFISVTCDYLQNEVRNRNITLCILAVLIGDNIKKREIYMWTLLYLPYLICFHYVRVVGRMQYVYREFFSYKGHFYIFKFPFIFSAVMNSEHSSVF